MGLRTRSSLKISGNSSKFRPNFGTQEFSNLSEYDPPLEKLEFKNKGEDTEHIYENRNELTNSSDTNVEGNKTNLDINNNSFPIVNQWVLAYFDESAKYKLARIIGWKLIGESATHLLHLVESKDKSNGYPKINSKNLSSNLVKLNSSIEKNRSSLNFVDYEFYVHFRGLNRRLDRWVTGKNIKVDFELEELDDFNLREKLMRINSTLSPTHQNLKCVTKSRKRTIDQLQISDGEDPEEHEGMDHSALQAHEETTRLKTISKIRIGKYILDTWYFSPFPDEYQNLEILYFCEFCLEFFRHEGELIRHIKGCILRHPPGNEIYRKENISIFEIDGALAKRYAENLCYLAKLFLDHKTLQYDVEPFLFYIVTEVDEEGCHLVGYFSKEKISLMHYNLACILTLPCYQRKGYGKLLVDLSYRLSISEGKWGHPERPLSDLGRAIYKSWWNAKIPEILLEDMKPKELLNKQESGSVKHWITIENIIRRTGIRREDVLKTLEDNGILRTFYKQQLLYCEFKFLKNIIKHTGRPGYPLYDDYFSWVPYSRSSPSSVEALPIDS
ncbi:MOZ/SAS family protein [Cryptosporidium serpentis]